MAYHCGCETKDVSRHVREEGDMQQGQNELLQLWSVSTVARKLEVHRVTVLRLVASGQLRSFRVGNRIRIPVEAIKDYLARNHRPVTKAKGSDRQR